jgi:hypothetical protein
LEFVPDETFVLNVKTAQDDDSFEVVIIDPNGKKVFSDVLDADPDNYSQTRFHIPDDSQKGTWSVFVNAHPSDQQEAIFFGVDELPQHPLVIKPSSVNYEYKVDDASFLIAGESLTDVQMMIMNPYDDGKHIYIIQLPIEGKCTFTLDLEDYNVGVYDVKITDHIDDAITVFTVGLQPSRGIIAIETPSYSYFSGDRVLVLGDTVPDTRLIVEVFDPFENIVNSFSVTSDKNGAINTSFYLSSDAKEGTWKVKATSSPNFDSFEFDVISESFTEQHEPLVPEPDDNPHLETEPFCGEGTIYTEGICVVDKTENSTNPSSYSWGGSPYVHDVESPLKQIKSGITIEEIQCNDSLVLLQKYDGTPACVTPETKEKLIERGWVKTTTLQEIDDSSDSLNLNIARMEDGRISLHPENTCASLDLNRLTAQDIQRYKNDEKGLDENNILQITSKDLKEIPNIQELIYAVHSIEFPYNKYSSASLDGMTFVEYELFLMDKSMKKYGDSKGDYFKKLDGDYEERFTNPAKQGFTNHFEAPVILYNDDAYSVSGTYFWTSDEHEPRRMSFFPIDDINDDEKFITLTDEDMKSVPKIKDAIASIGTIKESVSASKGLPEDQWNQYREWFKQKSQDSLNSDRFRLIQYDNHLYSIGFGIC